MRIVGVIVAALGALGLVSDDHTVWPWAMGAIVLGLAVWLVATVADHHYWDEGNDDDRT